MGSFIKLNDITYTQRSQTIAINQSDLDPYGEIRYKVADNVQNPSYRPNNGDAAFLEPGTIVYSQQGFSPSVQLIVKSELDGVPVYLIFEADTRSRET